MDPATLSMLISGLGAGEKLVGGGMAALAGNEGIQAQQRILGQALAGNEAAYGQRRGTAGGLRFDQFGNSTYYDPTKQMWVTQYTPTQQRLIDEGQTRQELTNLRGEQASQDYDTARSGYLYNKPKTEAQSLAEILDLVQQAQGTGDRALSTLVNRQFLRQQGNMPVINATQYGEKTPGQQLAAQMLQARDAALKESQSRIASHQSEYLPALAAFEKTANTVGQVDPTGQAIKGMERQGQSDVLSADSDYEKVLADLFTKGGTNVAHSYDTAVKGGAALAAGGSSGNNLSALTKALAGNKGTGGQVGPTDGGTYDGSGGGTGGFQYDMSPSNINTSTVLPSGYDPGVVKFGGPTQQYDTSGHVDDFNDRFGTNYWGF
jgi:hypothetical protein